MGEWEKLARNPWTEYQTMPEEHLDHLLRLRDEVLNALEEADRDLSTVRMRVERLESDVRIGHPEPAEYAEAKGHLLPRAEARVVELYRDLQKLEDKINTARLRETAV